MSGDSRRICGDTLANHVGARLERRRGVSTSGHLFAKMGVEDPFAATASSGLPKTGLARERRDARLADRLGRYERMTAMRAAFRRSAVETPDVGAPRWAYSLSDLIFPRLPAEEAPAAAQPVAAAAPASRSRTPWVGARKSESPWLSPRGGPARVFRGSSRKPEELALVETEENLPAEFASGHEGNRRPAARRPLQRAGQRLAAVVAAADPVAKVLAPLARPMAARTRSTQVSDAALPAGLSAAPVRSSRSALRRDEGRLSASAGVTARALRAELQASSRDRALRPADLATARLPDPAAPLARRPRGLAPVLRASPAVEAVLPRVPAAPLSEPAASPVRPQRAARLSANPVARPAVRKVPRAPRPLARTARAPRSVARARATSRSAPPASEGALSAGPGAPLQRLNPVQTPSVLDFGAPAREQAAPLAARLIRAATPAAAPSSNRRLRVASPTSRAPRALQAAFARGAGAAEPQAARLQLQQGVVSQARGPRADAASLAAARLSVGEPAAGSLLARATRARSDQGRRALLNAAPEASSVRSAARRLDAGARAEGSTLPRAIPRSAALELGLLVPDAPRTETASATPSRAAAATPARSVRASEAVSGARPARSLNAPRATLPSLPSFGLESEASSVDADFAPASAARAVGRVVEAPTVGAPQTVAPSASREQKRATSRVPGAFRASERAVARLDLAEAPDLRSVLPAPAAAARLGHSAELPLDELRPVERAARALDARNQAGSSPTTRKAASVDVASLLVAAPTPGAPGATVPAESTAPKVVSGWAPREAALSSRLTAAPAASAAGPLATRKPAPRPARALLETAIRQVETAQRSARGLSRSAASDELVATPSPRAAGARTLEASRAPRAASVESQATERLSRGPAFLSAPEAGRSAKLTSTLSTSIRSTVGQPAGEQLRPGTPARAATIRNEISRSLAQADLEPEVVRAIAHAAARVDLSAEDIAELPAAIERLQAGEARVRRAERSVIPEVSPVRRLRAVASRGTSSSPVDSASLPARLASLSDPAAGPVSAGAPAAGASSPKVVSGWARPASRAPASATRRQAARRAESPAVSASRRSTRTPLQAETARGAVAAVTPRVEAAVRALLQRRSRPSPLGYARAAASGVTASGATNLRAQELKGLPPAIAAAVEVQLLRAPENPGRPLQWAGVRSAHEVAAADQPARGLVQTTTVYRTPFGDIELPPVLSRRLAAAEAGVRQGHHLTRTPEGRFITPRAARELGFVVPEAGLSSATEPTAPAAPRPTGRPQTSRTASSESHYPATGATLAARASASPAVSGASLSGRSEVVDPFGFEAPQEFAARRATRAPLAETLAASPALERAAAAGSERASGLSRSAPTPVTVQPAEVSASPASEAASAAPRRPLSPAEARALRARPFGNRPGLSAVLGAVDLGHTQPGLPIWARRASGEPLARGTGGDFVESLAKARSEEDVVRVIVEQGGALQQVASSLPRPVIQVIEHIRAEARSELEDRFEAARSSAPAATEGATLPQPGAARGRTGESRATAQVARALTALKAGPGPRRTEGVGADRVMKLARKLQQLIHLAEGVGDRDAARRQVRMAEDSAAARGEGQAAGSALEGGVNKQVDIEALGREVLQMVSRELETRRERRQEDPDGRNVWW